MLLMSKIGVASEYEAWVVDSLTQDTLLRLPFSDISWERIRNGVSAGSVVIPPEEGGPTVCRVIGGLNAWSQMLVIERDGRRVWDGPIMGWAGGESLTINAVDRSVMLGKRFIQTNVTLNPPNDDIYGALVSPVLNIAGYFTLTDVGLGISAMPYSVTKKPYFPPGETKFNILGKGKWRFNTLTSLAALFDELGSNAYFSWTQQNEVMHMYSAWLDPVTGIEPYMSSDFQRPTLNTATTILPTYEPAVTVNADGLMNWVYLGETGQGIIGFANPSTGSSITGYLDSSLYGAISDSEQAIVPVYYWNGSAYVYWDPHQYPSPFPTVTLEDIPLHPSFTVPGDGIGFDDLIPGIVADVDFPDSCMLDIPVQQFDPHNGSSGYRRDSMVKHARLEHLTVTVSMSDAQLKEDVVGSFAAIALGQPGV